MVTYPELFQFCLLIVAIISLIIQIFNKKITAPFQRSVFFSITLANRLRYCFLYFYYIRIDSKCQKVDNFECQILDRIGFM